MSSPQFSLRCENYMTNVCNGLTSLQQQEKFVDMTLAADGHFVKVHQLIISLASPYLKELILSAPCQHPVVFLNKISYPILCYILEYVYSGQVMVHKESLPDLVAAAKELHIKGLQDMDLLQDTSVDDGIYQGNPSLIERLQQNKSQSSNKDTSSLIYTKKSGDKVGFTENMKLDPLTEVEEDHLSDDGDRDSQSLVPQSSVDDVSLTLAHSQNISATTNEPNQKTVQYTLSNQGSLQLILNRFIYYVRYTHKNSNPPIRMWRCVDYIKTKCPAAVTTQGDVVIQRVSAHKHGFHDRRIMKKLNEGHIFAAIKDAEHRIGGQKKKK